LLLIGGRNLHTSVPAQLTLSRGEAVLARWDLTPGFFCRVQPLAAGVLDGDGYVPLSLRATSEGNEARVSLEQFDLQPDGVEMIGLLEGWHEPEYDPRTSRAWRWVAEQAVTWIRPIDRDLTLTLTGESPLRYFDTAPTVRVVAGTQELARFSPAADFTQQIRLPAVAVKAAGGRIRIETDRSFVPAERRQSADPRHLSLRLYDVSVR
jgi:hypothetical protein